MGLNQLVKWIDFVSVSRLSVRDSIGDLVSFPIAIPMPQKFNLIRAKDHKFVIGNLCITRCNYR